MTSGHMACHSVRHCSLSAAAVNLDSGFDEAQIRKAALPMFGDPRNDSCLRFAVDFDPPREPRESSSHTNGRITNGQDVIDLISPFGLEVDGNDDDSGVNDFYMPIGGGDVPQPYRFTLTNYDSAFRYYLNYRSLVPAVLLNNGVNYVEGTLAPGTSESVEVSLIAMYFKSKACFD